ncbi:hypothetical protein RFI_16256 [Reticulomyxa filosa]|uniref:Uncharacterized protein n=1 Tax=Reticulomyxa filosa TaxID=46433 RepID=X6N4W8_RETFI|nr:hypothetical protein RFI_16256 [Reticulomyxa filosa]|eukprot:ETO20948.1 hypothetical protein RFI_16256 [Reticulomyxa filosa]
MMDLLAKKKKKKKILCCIYNKYAQLALNNKFLNYLTLEQIRSLSPAIQQQLYPDENNPKMRTSFPEGTSDQNLFTKKHGLKRPRNVSNVNDNTLEQTMRRDAKRIKTVYSSTHINDSPNRNSDCKHQNKPSVGIADKNEKAYNVLPTNFNWDTINIICDKPKLEKEIKLEMDEDMAHVPPLQAILKKPRCRITKKQSPDPQPQIVQEPVNVVQLQKPIIKDLPIPPPPKFIQKKYKQHIISLIMESFSTQKFCENDDTITQKKLFLLRGKKFYIRMYTSLITKSSLHNIFVW